MPRNKKFTFLIILFVIICCGCPLETKVALTVYCTKSKNGQRAGIDKVAVVNQLKKTSGYTTNELYKIFEKQGSDKSFAVGGEFIMKSMMKTH